MKDYVEVCLIGDCVDGVARIMKGGNIPFRYSRVFDDKNLNVAVAHSTEDGLKACKLADYVVCVGFDVCDLACEVGNAFSAEDFSLLVTNVLACEVRKRENMFLLEKLVNYELEKLDVPKNYAGYSGLLHILGVDALLTENSNILMRSIERDVYRLITRCWNESRQFRLALNPYLQRGQMKLNSKNILTCLKLYINATI